MSESSETADVVEQRRRLGAESFGLLVSILRDTRKVSQQSLAESAGVSRSWLAQLEAGKAAPKTGSLADLEEALTLPPGDLVSAWSLLVNTVPDHGVADRTAAEYAFFKGRSELLTALAGNSSLSVGARMAALAQRQQADLRMVPGFRRFVAGEPASLASVAEGLSKPVRVVLLAELWRCSPSAPFSIEFSLTQRQRAMTVIASSLGFSDPDTVKNLRQDHDAFMHEVKDSHLTYGVGPSVFAAAGSSVSTFPESLRGRDLVGWLGWGAAGGLFVASAGSRDLSETSFGEPLYDQPPLGGVIPICGTTLASQMAAQVGLVFQDPEVQASLLDSPEASTRFVQAIAGADRNRRNHGYRTDVWGSPFDATATALSLLGRMWVRREMNLMMLVYRTLGRHGLDGAPDDMIPTVEQAVQSLDAVGEALTRRHGELAEYSDADAFVLKRHKELTSIVARTAQSLRGLLTKREMFDKVFGEPDDV